MKYIIDTDIGDDIDDALALLFALESRLDIIGITTVFKDTEKRARIAKKILNLKGNGYEHIPVYAGYGIKSGERSKDYPDLCQYDEELENDAFSPDSCEPDDAINFIISSCKKYGNELTVIAIGPFTNIAKVINKAPDALSSSRLVIMGGAYFKQYADWNVMCDTEAAKCIFDSARGIKCVGADVTHRLILSAEEDKKISLYRGDPLKEYISKLYDIWKRASGASVGVLHDPLAICFAADESVCECVSSPVAVITEGYGAGMTLNVNSYGKAKMNSAFADFDRKENHYLAKEVDRERVIKAFMKLWDQ